MPLQMLEPEQALQEAVPVEGNVVGSVEEPRPEGGRQADSVAGSTPAERADGQDAGPSPDVQAAERDDEAGGLVQSPRSLDDTEGGWVRRFTDTLVGVMFRPSEFFTRMDTGRVWRAVRFGWVLAWLAAVVFAATARYEIARNPQAWLDAVGAAPSENSQQIIDGALSLFSLVLWTSPLLGLLNVLVSAVLYHIGILLLAEKPARFRATVCVTSFGFAPMVMALVPGIGQLVGSMWSLWVQVLGLALVHRTSVLRSAVAVVVPSALGVMLLGLLV